MNSISVALKPEETYKLRCLLSEKGTTGLTVLGLTPALPGVDFTKIVLT